MNEFKRMQKLAGINEIRVNNPINAASFLKHKLNASAYREYDDWIGVDIGGWEFYSNDGDEDPIRLQTQTQFSYGEEREWEWEDIINDFKEINKTLGLINFKIDYEDLESFFINQDAKYEFAYLTLPRKVIQDLLNLSN